MSEQPAGEIILYQRGDATAIDVRLDGDTVWLTQEQMAELFGKAKSTINEHIKNVFEEGEWAILEWRDPLGLRGCGFFHVVGGKIVFQRGYWDKLSFLRANGLPLPGPL